MLPFFELRALSPPKKRRLFDFEHSVCVAAVANIKDTGYFRCFGIVFSDALIFIKIPTDAIFSNKEVPP